MPASAKPRWTECQLSLPPHSAYYYIQTRHGEGEVGISETVAAAAGALGLCKVLCELLVIADRNTPFLSSSARQSYAHCCSLPPPHRDQPTDIDRPSTLVSHCQTVADWGSLTYCATLGGIDHDHWSRSAVDDVTIIDHFVKWSRQALIGVKWSDLRRLLC